MNIYTHLDEEDKEIARKKLNKKMTSFWHHLTWIFVNRILRMVHHRGVEPRTSWLRVMWSYSLNAFIYK
jgi:hypothetical protein